MSDAGHVGVPPVETPRRTHPLTPVVGILQAAPAVGVVWFLYLRDLRTGSATGGLALGVLLVAVLIGGYRWLEWWRFTWWFDADGDLRVDSGVLRRSERRIQLSRLQAVDVNQPLAARMMGLAALNVEVAGAGESRVRLAYLGLAEAAAVRDGITARAAGTGVGVDGSAVVEAPLVAVGDADLLWSLVLQGRTVVLAGVTLLFVGLTVGTGGLGALGIAVVTGGLPAFAVVAEFNRFRGFTLSEVPGGLRLRHGFTRTVTNTVPPGRVQAVGFTESWLWRWLGWVRVELNVAGTAVDDDVATVLLPVTTWDVALDVLARVYPGVDPRAVTLHAAPRRARWRSPFQWGRLAVGHDARVTVARRGRLVWRTSVVPHERSQSVRVTQDPWARRLGLASVHVDSTPGPVTLDGLHLDAARARVIAEELCLRSSLARRASARGVGDRP